MRNFDPDTYYDYLSDVDIWEETAYYYNFLNDDGKIIWGSEDLWDCNFNEDYPTLEDCLEILDDFKFEYNYQNHNRSEVAAIEKVKYLVHLDAEGYEKLTKDDSWKTIIPKYYRWVPDHAEDLLDRLYDQRNYMTYLMLLTKLKQFDMEFLNLVKWMNEAE